MSWQDSLIKLATYDVEMRQQQLAEIMGRLAAAETRLRVMTAEGEAEAKRAATDADAAWHHAAYVAGLRIRKAAVLAEIDAIQAEERGARDALALAFEEQKKYEQVAENARVAAAKEAGRRETAVLDELGMQRAARKAG
jgi:flagellar FliJ protein